jgi:hypothetical protein
MIIVPRRYSWLTQPSLNRAALRILASILDGSSSLLSLLKTLVSQSSLSRYSVQFLRNHFVSSRVSNA